MLGKTLQYVQTLWTHSTEFFHFVFTISSAAYHFSALMTFSLTYLSLSKVTKLLFNSSKFFSSLPNLAIVENVSSRFGSPFKKTENNNVSLTPSFSVCRFVFAAWVFQNSRTFSVKHPKLCYHCLRKVVKTKPISYLEPAQVLSRFASIFFYFL